jgi:hypothetical protein
MFMTAKVHFVGDSTLDNGYWMLEQCQRLGEAHDASVEGQLQTKLDAEAQDAYKVVNHAYDGFTTSSVLNGGNVGEALTIAPRYVLTKNKMAYLKDKNIDPKAESYFTQPLFELGDSIAQAPDAIHYVVISVGGNDFRERLADSLAMLREIPRIHERYLQILKKVKTLKEGGYDIRPILMFQYRLDTHNDEHYRIYNLLKKVGVVSMIFNLLSLVGVIASVAMVLKSQPWGLLLGLAGLAALALSSRVIPLKVTAQVLRGQTVSLATLGGLMERFYSPILAHAKQEGIPILDLPNTFNPHDPALYINQIEPSAKGGALIAEGIKHIVINHEFSSKRSIMYAKKDGVPGFTGSDNPGSRGWQVAYPQQK